MDEIKNYSELVKLGMPDFIEVKGVTFCGDSDARYLFIFSFFSIFFSSAFLFIIYSILMLTS